MRFSSTSVEGAMIIELEVHEDERGHFARSFCERELAHAGIVMRVVQTNISHNSHTGTLRGLHYQREPYGEPKIVQCMRGRIWDVAVDLRADSASFRRWTAIELSPDAGKLFYIPTGCAHGFITLESDSDVLYLMGAAYVPEAARGVRWNDPAFDIAWPASPALISERDSLYADFRGETRMQ